MDSTGLLGRVFLGADFRRGDEGLVETYLGEFRPSALRRFAPFVR
jgi:hypothetical protein